MNASLPRLCRVWLPVALFLIVAAVFVVSWPDRDTVTDSFSVPSHPDNAYRNAPDHGVLRVGAPEPVRQPTVLSPYGPGFEFELVAGFCESFSCIPEWVVVPDKDAGFAMLRQNEIDVLVGFWGDGPAVKTPPVTAVPADPPTGPDAGAVKANPEAAAESATDSPVLVSGKAYAHFTPVRVTGAAPPGLGGNEAEPAATVTAEDMEETGSPSAIEGMSRFFAALIPDLTASEEQSAPSVPFTDTLPFPVYLHSKDAPENRDDVLLVHPASYALWLPFMGDVSSRRISQSIPYRWFWRHDATPLADALAVFWQDAVRAEELEELTERYFGFLPKNLRQRDILELSETLAEKLGDYDGIIREASKITGVPPLLLVAVIYQESRFDPDAVSETRVRGIMQLTAATAKMLNVNRNDPAQCIMGGARYLRDMYDAIGAKAATDWDRWFMALGAYNQGMSNLNRSIRIARELGTKGDVWADIKRAFPLNTACRGREARGFVERIRYYNFILHGLVALAPAETQDLAPLLGLAVVDTPL